MMREIKGYEGLYSINKKGQIWSHENNKGFDSRGRAKGKKGRFLKIQAHPKRGYPCVDLWKNKRRKVCTVHRLLATAFLSNPENKREVNHKNGIKYDNRLLNLEWVTPSENIQHSYDIGIHIAHPSLGEKHGLSILKEHDVIKIREERKFGLSYKQLAQKFHVTYDCIWDIINHRSWTHLQEGRNVSTK